MPDLIYIPAPNNAGQCVNCSPTDPCGNVVIPCNNCDPQLAYQYTVTLASGYSGCSSYNGIPYLVSWQSPSWPCLWQRLYPSDPGLSLQWVSAGGGRWQLTVAGYAYPLCSPTFYGPSTPCDPRGVYTGALGWTGTAVVS